MKSDFVRLIEAFEMKYERLQAENVRLKRKVNRMLKKEKQLPLKHRNYCSLSTRYSDDTYMRNSVSLPLDLAVECPQEEDTCNPRQTSKRSSPKQTFKSQDKQTRKSRRFRSFNKKLCIQTNVKV